MTVSHTLLSLSTCEMSVGRSLRGGVTKLKGKAS